MGISQKVRKGLGSFERFKMKTQLELLKESVFYITIECMENGEPVPFSRDDIKKDPYIVDCMKNCLEKNISEKKMLETVKKANHEASDYFLNKCIFEVRRKLFNSKKENE